MAVSRPARRQSESVSVSAYQQLASDLQRARTQCTALERENKVLKQRLAHCSEAAQYVQQVSVPENGDGRQLNLPAFPAPSPVFAEVRAAPSRRSQQRPDEGVSIWILLVLLVAIVLSFAGLGFAIVKPLVESD